MYRERRGEIMRIITVSRQFGSGGRELGRRLSDLLGWDYMIKKLLKLSQRIRVWIRNWYGRH